MVTLLVQTAAMAEMAQHHRYQGHLSLTQAAAVAEFLPTPAALAVLVVVAAVAFQAQSLWQEQPEQLIRAAVLVAGAGALVAPAVWAALAS